jgi:hypothetical protein
MKCKALPEMARHEFLEVPISALHSGHVAKTEPSLSIFRDEDMTDSRKIIHFQLFLWLLEPFLVILRFLVPQHRQDDKYFLLK